MTQKRTLWFSSGWPENRLVGASEPEIPALYEAGKLTVEEIAAVHNVGVRTVVRYLQGTTRGDRLRHDICALRGRGIVALAIADKLGVARNGRAVPATVPLAADLLSRGYLVTTAGSGLSLVAPGVAEKGGHDPELWILTIEEVLVLFHQIAMTSYRVRELPSALSSELLELPGRVF